MRPTGSRFRRLFGVIVAVCAMTTGCLSPPPELPHNAVTVSTRLPPRPPALPSSAPGYPQLGGTAPGSLLSMAKFDLIDPRVTITGATAWRIRYMSGSAVGGAPVEVTGTVIVPDGPPPDGGWQIIAFNHGNTGINNDCGPSLYDDMLNQWLPISVLLLHGFVVVASDYEGLGGSGHHAFLNSAALGRNVIDAVRAARHMRPDMGDRWAAFGGSLGGLATWAANEQATTYGAGLDLVGAATWVPVVNVSGLPAKAKLGTLTRDQMHLLFLAIVGLKATTHPELDLQKYVRGSLYENRDLLMLCSGPRIQDAIKVLDSADPADLVPADDEAERQLTGWLSEMAVPRQRAAAPMLVVYGTNDRLVDQQWIDAALKDACALGTTIEWVLRPGEGHGDIDASMAFPWLRARFDNQKPINKCPTVPGNR